MYKMLLVEDEPATIQGIKTAVNWSLLNISICGEAANGLEALPLIEELKPDIILCDIRMPKMDGITLISGIQPHHPNIKVIFLSGYSDKEYLKKAIKLNVIDYIYKPLELSELIQAVEKAKSSCDMLATAKKVQDSNLALNMIQGWNPRTILKETLVDPDDYFITIIIRFNMSMDSTMDTYGVAVSQYQPQFQKVFTDIFGARYVASSVNNGYILHANVSKDFFRHKEAIQQLSKLFQMPGEAIRYMTIGISDPVESSANLKDSFQQARAAVHSAFLNGYGKAILYSELSQTQFSPYTDLENQLFHQIQINNMATAIDFLEEYIEGMKCCRPDDIPAIKDELASISFRLSKMLKKQEHVQQSFITQTINYALEITDIRNYLMNLLEQILSEFNSLDNKGRIIIDVERFILANYSKDLSIKEIADHVYITPTYLCHLYKSKTGRTINQFILDVKMNKSKKLITDTTMKLSEISEKLGYSNQNYFTRIFTKYYGVTPSTFRNKRL